MTLPASYGVQRGWPVISGQAALIATAPAAVASFTVTPGNTQNSIAWTDGATGGSAITGHKLYRSTTAGFTPGAGNLLGTIATASPYLDTGLTNGTPYYYQISAVNAVGEGALSGQQSGTPSAAPAFTPAYQFNDARNSMYL